MATTYQLITSTELSSTANSVTFSSIPQNFTDLEVRISTRQYQVNNGSPLYHQINGDSTSTNYVTCYWDFQSSPSTSSHGNSNYLSQMTDGGTVANGFSYMRMYYFNYTNTTTYKPFIYTAYYGKDGGGYGFTYSNDGVSMRNNTAAITSLTYPAYNSGSQYFVAGSLFELYGIKNS